MRVAAIAFRNALPLLHGLPWPIDRFAPAELTCHRLARYDLALAPVVVAFDDPRWGIQPDAPGIGCTGSVGTVRLELRRGLTRADLRRIALSPTSQTSNQLLQVLCIRAWGLPRDALHFAVTNQGETMDAHLVIGDAALETPEPQQAIDLGGAWHTWTGLPFVFAAWMARRPLPPDVLQTLRTTRDGNLCHLDPILARCETDPAQFRHYVTAQLNYTLTPAHHRGLARFREELSAWRDGTTPPQLGG